jgi:alpha-galactosidase
MFVSPDRSEAFAVHVTVLNEPNARLERLRLKGLDPERRYELIGTEDVIGGDELMHAGIIRPRAHEDFSSIIYRFKAI